MSYLLVAGGLGLLLLGGEFLVRGAVGLAKCLGVSPLVIGLTVVAYGTTLPELLVSVDANLRGAPGIAVGNVVGSNIANILLILGCAALIYPIVCQPHLLRRSCTMVMGAAVVMVLLGLGGTITYWHSIPMIAVLLTFSVMTYQMERKRTAQTQNGKTGESPESEEILAVDYKPAKSAWILLGGFIGVVAGSHFLVDGSVALARAFGVSEAVIGLTLVAVGTSLPELATGIVSAYRRHSEVALGNVLGANTFNILGIMGIVPLTGAISVPEKIVNFDLWAMLGITLAFVLLMQFFKSLGRPIGVLFLFLYAMYVACQYFGLSGMVTPQS